jgi:entericidin A
MTKHILALLIVTFALSACNTIQGVGKDLSKAGETIEEAAKKK